MKYAHLKSDLAEIKKYLSKRGQGVFYQDQIDGGYSLKVEYLTTGVSADDTAEKLMKRFPQHFVRILEPNEMRRPGGYSVRIWVK